MTDSRSRPCWPARCARLTAIAIAVGLALAPSRAAAQGAAASPSAEAERLFVRAEKLRDSGKVAEACAEFQASNAIEPRAGTLINIGFCEENVGKLASALAAFRDALKRVKDPRKKQIATQRIAALEPRVSRLTIEVADDARLAGLAITRDDQPVAEELYGQPVALDGGGWAIAATAPGHEPWFTTVRVPVERGNVVVTVPALRLREVPAERSRWARLSTRRKAAVLLGVAGLGLVGTGIGFGVVARSAETEAFQLCPEPSAPCADAPAARERLDRAHSRALLANVAYAAGGAALAGAALLWLTGKTSSSRVSLSPRAGGPGVDLQVRF